MRCDCPAQKQRTVLQCPLLGLEIHPNDAEPVGAFYDFSISDNGPGIAPEFHQKVWGIFQTLEPRDKVEGTGSGLAVVKKVVESSWGRRQRGGAG